MSASLKSKVTPEMKVDEFIMLWKSPAFANKVLVLVEGPTDRLFYYKFFNDAAATVRDCGGCKKVIEIHKGLQSRKGIVNITIKDSDFERLNGNLTLEENFFFADCHDYEMMCVRDEEVMKEVFVNMAIEYKSEWKNDVFVDLKLLSYFKWYNYTNHTNYNFNTYSVAAKTSDELNNFDCIHQAILPVSPKRTETIDKQTLLEFISGKEGCNLYELTNGHDFLKRLCHYIQQQFPERTNLNENEFKKTLHPCFRIENFMQTDLYRDIKGWEVDSGKKILRFIE